MSENTTRLNPRKHPLWHLFGTVVLLIVVIPVVLWSIVQLYEFLCTWYGGCEGITRARGPN